MELSISGIDLPDEFECHFSNSRSVAAKRQIGENGVVTIPDEYFLSNAAQIFCWIYLHPTVDSGVTEYEIVIPLRQRPNVDPSEPTQEQQDIVDQAIAALNVAMAETSADAESASASATAAQAAVDSVLNMTVSADTLPSGSDASVTKSVVDDAVHLAFGIPQGAQGVQGEQGVQGPTGATPNITIGTVQTLLPTQDATATITGTAEAPVLNLGIPKGYSGDATNLAADYSSNKIYAVGEYCIYNGSLYRCITAITTAEAWTAAHWAAAVLGDDVGDLKSDLPNTYVALAGENQVTPQNIAGMQFTKTEGTVDGENIFSSDMLFREGQYVISYEGIVSIGSNASFKAYCVPVEQNSTYVFPECRFVVLATGNTVNSPTVGDTITYASQVETSNATYLFLSYADKPVSEITVKKRETTIVYSNFILPDWLNPKTVKKSKFKSVSGILSDGSTLIVQGCRNNTRKGERVVFYGNITSFNSIDFGISISETTISAGTINIFTIDGTNITYTESPNNTPVVVQHGLTIADNIQIVGEESATGTYKISVISGGSLFMHEFNYSQKSIGAPYVSSAGSVITEAKLTWTCTDLDRQIWMFGDSYFAYSPDRWTYYLHDYGYDQNCLLDGWPGMGSVNARVSFSNLLSYGTPQFAVWCMGMNDGGDTDASTPNSDWTNGKNYFLGYCAGNNVTPIFATIPTVPTVNNEGKNAWIRASGYRYIDFALAVGATSSGTWYSGMLSSDNVHPTEKGAKALFARFMVDFPEIMVSE